MTNIGYPTHVTNSSKFHPYIYIVSSILHSFIIGSKFHKVKTKTKDKHSISEITRNDLKLNIYFPRQHTLDHHSSLPDHCICGAQNSSQPDYKF